MKSKRATEDYVRTIYQLSQKGKVRCCQIAKCLSVSRPTALMSIRILSEEGLVYQDDLKNIYLTEKGIKLAQKVEAKHRVLYELLVMVGVDEEIASRDACKMEHGLGEESFLALQSLVRDPD